MVPLTPSFLLFTCLFTCLFVYLFVFVADTDGFVKVLSDADTDRILGIHMIGSVSI